MQKFFYRKKIQLQVWKSGVFWEKKIKIPIGSRPFFWLEPLVLHVLCRSRVHLSLSTWTTSLARSVPKPGAPTCDTPPLTTASEASGDDWATEWPTDRKRFSDFFSNLQIWGLGKINVPLFGKYVKNVLNRKIFQLQVEIFEKKIKFLMGNRHFFPRKKGSLICLKLFTHRV